MQIFLAHLLEQTRIHRLSAELILVEWNPPSDRPPLSAALAGIASSADIPVRIITVPAEVHERFKHARELPLFQMLGKNVGLRRALGRYALCTNIDILFNDELTKFLAAQKLEADAIYRINRWDVDERAPFKVTAAERLAYCRRHLVRVAAREGTIPLEPEGRLRIFPDDIVAPEDGIKLGLGWFPLVKNGKKPSRWLASEAEIFMSRQDQGAGVALLLESGPQLPGPYAEIQLLDQTGRVLAAGCLLGRHWLHFRLPVQVEGEQRFRIRVVNGGQPDPVTGWIRDVQVFKIKPSLSTDLAQQPVPVFRRLPFKNAVPELADSDSMQLPDGIRLGARWQRFENRDGFATCWADDGAELHIDFSTVRTRTLQLKIEAGPGVDYAPFTLELRDAAGVLAGKLDIAGNPQRRKRYLKNKQRRETTVSSKPGPEQPHSQSRTVKRLLRYFKQMIFPPYTDYVLSLSKEANLQSPLTLRVGTCKESDSISRHRVFRLYGVEFLPHIGGANIHASEVAAMPSQQQPLGPAPLHTNACGDFTLMALEQWKKLCGYPEFEAYSMHLDSLGLYAAAALGLREIVLPEPMRIYHLEHGAGWTPEGEAHLYARLKAQGIPVTTYRQLLEYAVRIRKEGPLSFNTANWGLAQENFTETVLAEAGRTET